MMMHNEVVGVKIGIYNYKILEKPFFILELDRSFFTLNHGCKYCILQKKIGVFIKILCYINTTDCIKR